LQRQRLCTNLNQTNLIMFGGQAVSAVVLSSHREILSAAAFHAQRKRQI